MDPIRTISAGKVNLGRNCTSFLNSSLPWIFFYLITTDLFSYQGAFRTYPKGYKPPDEEASEYQTIPLNKIEDFGVHCKQYYSLDVSYFKSNMDKVAINKLIQNFG